jgi:hypothetical protein
MAGMTGFWFRAVFLRARFTSYKKFASLYLKEYNEAFIAAGFGGRLQTTMHGVLQDVHQDGFAYCA